MPLLAENILLKNNTLTLIKNNTILSLPLQDITSVRIKPKILFTKFKTSDAIYTISKPISLSFKESRYLEFFFNCNDLANTSTAYAYAVQSSLRHKNIAWQNAKDEKILLPNLESGTYYLLLKAINPSGVESEITFLKIIIKPPFWKTLWFIIFTSIVIITIVIVIIFSIIKRKNYERNLELKLMKSEFVALNSLMNPHFVFNTLNNVQSLINKEDKVLACKYIQILSDLMRQNLINVTSDLISLAHELELVTNYLNLEKLRFKDLFNYHFYIDQNINVTEIFIPPLLIQPLVENSIKYSNWNLNKIKGEIYIRILKVESKHSVKIEVQDNGGGINKKEKAEKQSMALNNISSRLFYYSKMHNLKTNFNFQEITDKDSKLKGVFVCIEIEY